MSKQPTPEESRAAVERAILIRGEPAAATGPTYFCVRVDSGHPVRFPRVRRPPFTCVKCDAEIPPGKPGRKCPRCRAERKETQ